MKCYIAHAAWQIIGRNKLIRSERLHGARGLCKIQRSLIRLARRDGGTMSAQLMVRAATVRRLGAKLSAEVIGLDLAQPCDQARLGWIRDTLQEHRALCIRRQALSE